MSEDVQEAYEKLAKKFTLPSYKQLNEEFELDIIETYLPAKLSEAEIQDIIEAAISELGASSIKDMGKVMGLIKGQLQGRADMGKVSGLIKSRLNS